MIKQENMKKGTLLILFALFGLMACDCDDDLVSVECELKVQISSELYAEAPNDDLTINSLKIEDNCLKINFSASGCSGDSWELKLIDSEDILESDPPQRNLRLSLKNKELCDAYFSKEISFDISSLQVDGNRVQLNITNSDDQILYEY